MKTENQFVLYIVVVAAIAGTLLYWAERDTRTPEPKPVVVAKDKGYTEITTELVRTDDHERGVSCYYFKDWNRALSCVPMRDK